MESSRKRRRISAIAFRSYPIDCRPHHTFDPPKGTPPESLDPRYVQYYEPGLLAKDFGDAMKAFTDEEKRLRLESRNYEMKFLGHGRSICSGSDDGVIFIEDRKSTNAINVLWGNVSIVNCFRVTSSIKLWSLFGKGTIAVDLRTVVQTNPPMWQYNRGAVS
ncbi:hypothetical protein ILUMI_06118 [Ignelater luminosus]|uniref:Uncharacterized protein n=1 Tax=Ignelater luminosus TaxID=2038154 RepID=A0A8K0D612_IGNLU|nr:hypothetical protein ILUMI_06118 [Ignelater luminosus]